MEVGSAVNCATLGAAGFGASGATTGGGGGGGAGAGTFFLHPAANIASASARQLSVGERKHRLQNSFLSPHGSFVLPGRGQSLQLGSIGIDHDRAERKTRV